MNLFWSWLFRFRFRYDVFISYAHQDGKAYALRLRDQLKALDYACFLDVDEAPAGGKLTPTLQRAIHRSAALVMVGSPVAAGSKFVRLEVETFAATGRDVLPIYFVPATAARPLVDRLPTDVIWIEDQSSALASGEPSALVADAIDRGFKFTRRNVRVRVQIVATAVAFILGALVSTMLIRSGIRQTREATTLAETRQQAAVKATEQAERERDEATRQKTLAEKATGEAETQRIAAVAASEQAKAAALLAKEQERLALESAKHAAEQQSRAQALYLVEQGLHEADRAPLLGLRVALEGWFSAPPVDAPTRTAIAARLREMAGTGRVASIALSPQSVRPFFVDRSPLFVTSDTSASAIRRMADGAVVSPLKGGVASVESAYEAESEAEALAHPESRLWIIKYQDGVNEIRDGSTGALIVSGDIDGTLGTFGPAFGVRFKSKRIELRAGIDPRRVVAELPATSEYLKVVPELPGLLFVNTTSRSVELRRIADGSLIDEVRGLETLFSPQASPDGSYLTLQHEGQSYEDRWFELRQAPTWSVVPLGDKPRSIVFSPKGRLFVVGYRGRPTELRTPGVVATFGGELATCVFSADGAMFAISYADRSGEIRSATGALILRLPNPVASLNLSADGRHFAIGYQWERQATATARKPRVDPFDAPLRFDPAPGETAVELRRVTDGSLVVRKDGAAEIVNPTSAKDLYAFMSRAITPGDRQVVSIYHRRLGDLLLPASGEPFALHAFTNAPYLEISPRFSFSAGGTDTFLVRNDTGAFTKIATYFHLGSIDQDLWFNDSRSRYVLQNGELRRTEDDTLLTTIPSISTFRPPSFSAVRDLVVVCVDSVRDNDHCELRRVADGSLIKRIGDTYASEITWSFRADAFYVSDTNRTSALYRSGDGERIMRSDQVTFLPDSLALVKTVEGRFEIWAVDEPKPLADLGAGLADSRVTPDGRYLLAWFRDASPAVIDLVWLRAGRAITSEPTRALLDWACAPFSVSTAIDLSGLNKYISEPTSSATCPTVR